MEGRLIIVVILALLWYADITGISAESSRPIHIIEAPAEPDVNEFFLNAERKHGEEVETEDVEENGGEKFEKLFSLLNPDYDYSDEDSIERVLRDQYVIVEINSMGEIINTTHMTNSSSTSTDTQVLSNEDNNSINNLQNVLPNNSSHEIEANEDNMTTSDSPVNPDVINTFLKGEREHTVMLEREPVAFESVNVNVRTNEVTPNPNLTVCGVVNLNKIVDEVIDGLRKDIIDKGYDKIKIPDIHEKFTRRVGIVNVKGDFTAERGWAKNLSTVYRTADVIASSQGNSITVACGFGLSHLEFGYDSYKAHILRLGPHGTLDAKILNNSILLNATVVWSDKKCMTTLNDLTLNELGGFNLKVTGLGPFNWLLTRISNWAFKNFSTQIKQKIEATLKDLIEKNLKSFDCSKYLRSLLQL